MGFSRESFTLAFTIHLGTGRERKEVGPNYKGAVWRQFYVFFTTSMLSFICLSIALYGCTNISYVKKPTSSDVNQG